MKRTESASPGYIRAMFYGMPGSGKTRLLGTAAESFRVLWLDAGGNPQSIRDYEEQPDIIEVEQLKDLNDPYDWIKRGQPKNDPLVKDFDLYPPYSALVIDQITELQVMYFDHVMGTSKSKGPGDIVVKREWDHYNKVMYSMLNFSRLYFDLPLHVFSAAQEREADPDRSRKVGPLLEGQSQAIVTSYCNLIGRIQHITSTETKIARLLKDEDIQVVTFFKQSSKYQAKDQVSGGRLGSYMTDPTIPRIMEAINANAS